MNEHDALTGAKKVKIEGNVSTDLTTMKTDLTAIKVALQGIQAILEEEKTIDGNVSVTGTAVVAGATTLQSTLAVTGAATLSGDFAHGGSKAGFQNATPIAKPTAYTQTYATASRTVAAVATTFSAVASTSEYIASVTDLITVSVGLENLKKNVNSIIDDLQSYGLFQ